MLSSGRVLTVRCGSVSTAATRVLSKGAHSLHNVKLQVRRPPLKDPCRLLLRGINPNTSMEMVELYVENMMDLNVGEYTLFPSPGGDVILIQLSQPISTGLWFSFRNVETRSVLQLGLITTKNKCTL